MVDEATANAVFTRLKDVLAPYRPPLVARTDEPGNLYLEAPPTTKRPEGLYFGGAKIVKRYISFHLMPVYVHPDLLGGISPELRRRMQGKSCFNFTRADDALFAELARLTAAGFARFQADGEISPFTP